MMWIILPTVLIAVSAALTIHAEYYGPPKIVYLCKPLATCCLVLLALVPKNPVPQSYRYLIVTGLVCSLAGDVFLMLPSDRFVAGLASFLIAHLCYIAAFALVAGGPAIVLAGVVIAIVITVRTQRLWRDLGKLKWPVAVYSIVIFVMAWIAVGGYVRTWRSGGFAALGALLFVISDFTLAVNRFRGVFRAAQLLILSTYFAAQWLIALST